MAVYDPLHTVSHVLFSPIRLSSFHLTLNTLPRCGLCPLPPFVGVGLIDQCAATPSAAHVSSSPFRRRDPTAACTLHDIAGRGELQLVAPLAGTAKSDRVCPPHVVVMMGFADQRMGDLMEKRVVDLLCGGVLGKFIR